MRTSTLDRIAQVQATLSEPFYVVALGVGSVDRTQLKELSADSGHLFFSESYEDALNAVGDVTKSVCIIPPPPPKPIHQGLY